MSTNATVAPEILYLQSVSRNINIILGLTLFIGGIISNLLNIMTFSKLGTWKYNPSSFYILVKSFADILCISTGALLETVGNAFLLKLTTKNHIWCQLRFPLTCILFLMSLTCICLQSIDVFFCSSQSAALRQKSNIRVARYLIIGFLFLWIAQAIPYIIFQELIQIGNRFACIGKSPIYIRYVSSFVSLGLFVVIPITIISIFGVLTYRNIRINTQNRQLIFSILRQMVNIAFFQIFSLLLFQFPFGVMLVYNLATSDIIKDSYRQTKEQVAMTFLFTFALSTSSVSDCCH